MMKPKVSKTDVHFVVYAFANRLKCFDGTGRLKWTAESRCTGSAGDYEVVEGDTPPGLYKCGAPDDVLETEGDSNSFGPWFVPLIEMEDQLTSRGRAGVGVHGGGSGLTDPFRALKQGWVVTNGCVRLQNEDLIRFVGTVRYIQKMGGVVWFSVSWK